MKEKGNIPNSPEIELTLRHIREGGALFRRFLIGRRDIDPNFADDTTVDQNAAWDAYSSDLRITQEIELHELRDELEWK